MALPTPPFPPSGRFVESVRESSRALTQVEAVTVSACASANNFQFPLFVPVGNSGPLCTRFTRVSPKDKKLDKRSVHWISSYPLCFLPETCYESGFLNRHPMLVSIWASGYSF